MDNYREYFFFLTNNCPNRCKYCYIDFHSKDMTTEQIDKYMEELKPSRIIFFGGEPLLRLDLIEYTVKKYYGKCKFQVVTSTMANFKDLLLAVLIYMAILLQKKLMLILNMPWSKALHSILRL